MKVPKSSGLFYSLLISFARVGKGLQKSLLFFSLLANQISGSGPRKKFPNGPSSFSLLYVCMSV